MDWIANTEIGLDYSVIKEVVDLWCISKTVLVFRCFVLSTYMYRVYTVCHSNCMCWTNFSMERPLYLNRATACENQHFAYAKTKTQISFTVTAMLISAFVFATWIVQSLYFLNPKFHASSHLLWLYSLVCVGPGQKPERWFSHDKAQYCGDYSKYFGCPNGPIPTKRLWKMLVPGLFGMCSPGLELLPISQLHTV